MPSIKQNTPINAGLIFKYFWPHVKRYKKSLSLVFIGYGLATVGTGIISPILYKQIIDTVSSNAPSSATADQLIHTVILLGVVLFAYNVFFRIADWAMTYSQSNLMKDLSDDAFRRIGAHSYEFFSNTFTGTMVARVRRYVNAFETIQDQVTFAVWMSGLRLVFAIAVLCYFSLVLAGIFIGWFIVYILMMVFFVRRKIVRDIRVAEANSTVTAALADAITNILNIKMFATSKKEFDRYAAATAEERNLRSNAWNFQNTQFMFQGFFIAFFEFIGIFAAVYLWIKGIVSPGTILLMQVYIFASFDIAWNIGRNMARVVAAVADAKEMVEVFELPADVSDPTHPEPSRITKGDIVIDNIRFAYGKNDPVFNNFSLHIKAGEKVGIVGPSGSGKTTITKLLLRFADIQKGAITIDGQRIDAISQDSLRRTIAYVLQDPILFHRSLRENIAYASPDATEEEIAAVARKAHAADFIEKLPLAYETYVGERGIKLSGGERQRVAIARAMLKDAPILILDEATSSLDSISEKYIQEAFDELMKGRTTIVIAHRLSTIQKMDRIIVLHDGVIAEEGSHKSLVAKRGLYHTLWKQQSDGFVATSDEHPEVADMTLP